MNDEDPLKKAWREFLSRWRWDWFLTITFRQPRLPHHASSSLREIGRTIERETDGRYFLGTELHVNRTMHVHGLLQAPGASDGPASKLVASNIWLAFYDRYGRSQVRRVRSREAVSDYCTKYVTKELTEWHIRI